MNKLEATAVMFGTKVKSSVKTVAKRKPEKSSQLVLFRHRGGHRLVNLNPVQAKFFFKKNFSRRLFAVV